jgi:hypothetical protein
MAMTLAPMSAVVATLSECGTKISGQRRRLRPPGHPTPNASRNVTRCRQRTGGRRRGGRLSAWRRRQGNAGALENQSRCVREPVEMHLERRGERVEPVRHAHEKLERRRHRHVFRCETE